MGNNFYKEPKEFLKMLVERIQRMGPMIYGCDNYENFNIFIAECRGENDYTIGFHGGISGDCNLYTFHRGEYERLFPNLFRKVDHILPEIPNLSTSTEIIKSYNKVDFTSIDFSQSEFIPIEWIGKEIVFKSNNKILRQLIDVIFQTFMITQTVQSTHANTKHLTKFDLSSMVSIILHSISVDSKRYHNGWRMEDQRRKDEIEHNYEFRIGDLTNEELVSESTDLATYESHSMVVLKGKESKLKNYDKFAARIGGIRPGNGLNLYNDPKDKGLMFLLVYILCDMINSQSYTHPMIVENK